MALFMDSHAIDGGVKASDVAQAHLADLQTQDRYGVRYLRYWVDEGAGRIFCLVDAPDAEAAIRVHREAHGLVADTIHRVVEGRMLGRTRCGAGDRRGARSTLAIRTRSSRWDRSASSSWSARLTASSTSSDTMRVAALQLGVVLDADVGEQCDLLPPQAGHPPLSAVHRKAGLLRADPGAARAQELADPGRVAHPPTLRPNRGMREVLAIPPIGRDFLRRTARAWLSST